MNGVARKPADDGDMRKFRQRKMLVDLYRDFAASAFGWAEMRRREPVDVFPHAASPKEAAANMQRYMESVPNCEREAQFPGRPTYLIGLAFKNMGQSADEWEEWGRRLTQAHDELHALFESEYGPQQTEGT